MQFESYRRPTPTINLSALIDVVFILVIFIVLAANFDRIRDLELTLPSANASGSAPPEALTVSIPVEGPISLGGEPVAEEEIRDRLSALRPEHDALLLRADGSIALERAVWVLGEASAAGFENVSIATQEPSR